MEWDVVSFFGRWAAEWNKCQIIPPHFVVTGKHASSAAAAEPALFLEQYSTLPDNNECCVKKRWREASTSWVIGNYRSNPTHRHVKRWYEWRRGEISTIGRGSSFVCALLWRWSWEIIKSFRHRHFFLSIPFFSWLPSTSFLLFFLSFSDSLKRTWMWSYWDIRQFVDDDDEWGSLQKVSKHASNWPSAAVRTSRNHSVYLFFLHKGKHNNSEEVWNEFTRKRRSLVRFAFISSLLYSPIKLWNVWWPRSEHNCLSFTRLSQEGGNRQ